MNPDSTPKPETRLRLPPGQREVDDFPVLDLGTCPQLAHDDWQLRLFGLLAQPQTLDWDALQALPQVQQVSDFHCVTHWSQFDMHWEGVRTADLLARLQPLPEARHVTLHGADGYTTNLPLSLLADPAVLLAHSWSDAPLSAAHGGPVRLMVPQRYGWKSAKWLVAIEFHAEDRPGYWEVRGYHNDADPWREQRYAHD